MRKKRGSGLLSEKGLFIIHITKAWSVENPQELINILDIAGRSVNVLFWMIDMVHQMNYQMNYKHIDFLWEIL